MITNPVLQFDRPSTPELVADAEFWSLYDASFPVDEREPRAVIAGSVERGVGVVLRARSENRTVGLATAHLLRNPASAFLVYLAVSPDHRRRGLGRSLFEEVARLGQHGVAWEVDIPERADSPQERARRERRISFFRDLGGEIVLRSYMQPPVNGVAKVPMYLMARIARGETLRVEDLVRAIYLEKYGDANGIDRAVLESLRVQSLERPSAISQPPIKGVP